MFCGCSVVQHDPDHHILRTECKSVLRTGGGGAILSGTDVTRTVVEWLDRTEDLAILAAIDETASTAAEGDFSRRIKPHGADENLEQVARQVNRICETIDRFLTEVETPVKAMADGDLSHRSVAEFHGRRRRGCVGHVERMEWPMDGESARRSTARGAPSWHARGGRSTGAQRSCIPFRRIDHAGRRRWWRWWRRRRCRWRW